jgi:ketosteroid isomerase-like protein
LAPQPISERRLTIVAAAVDRFNAGDYDTFLQIFAPDAVLHADPQVADRSEYHGRGGLAEWLAEAQRQWRTTRFKALSVVAAGDAVVVELAVVGESAAGGGAWRLYVRLAWDGELVSRIRAYPTRDDAFAAVDV